MLSRPVLEIGSMVQFGNPVQYGVIKDFKDDSYNKCAVIEIVSAYMHDKLYYLYIALEEDQPYKTIPLVELQPDSRFTSSAQEEHCKTLAVCTYVHIRLEHCMDY